MINRRSVKEILAQIPYSAELYWYLIQKNKPWQSHFSLDLLEKHLSDAVQQSMSFARNAPAGKKVFIFASLHYWIEHAAFLGLALAGKGHQVTFSFLPYSDWTKPINKFDLKAQNLYARQVLDIAQTLMKIQPLFDINPGNKTLPPELELAVDEVSVFDAQYTLQVEDITGEEPIYQLRKERNRDAALSALTYLEQHKPDVVIVPNGTIQEMGVIYRVARTLGLPTVTFEFSDQREHIWLAQNSEIMQHDTNDLWTDRSHDLLDEEKFQQLSNLFAARINAKTWKNFARQWQEVPTQGSDAVKGQLNLDERPIVLLATNVLGDSLTLGRQIFSQSMAEWVEKTVIYFAKRNDAQLVIRVHPGEVLTHGISMVDVIYKALPEIPAHIHLIKPQEKINTYDILEITDLGLVYSTTVGLEMSLRGIPVIVAAQTHYRSRGFTTDPETWDEYYSVLNEKLNHIQGSRLTQEQIEQAWRYAYLFFFAYPKPFPWHLLDLSNDVKKRPISYVLSPEGEEKYGKTLNYLAGEPLQW